MQQTSQTDGGGHILVLVTVLLLFASTPRAIAQQNSSANAVPPSIAIQPLYACLVFVSELPEYDGTPTPEMQAAAIGIRQSTEGMLEQWFISNDFNTYTSQTGAAGRSTAGSTKPISSSTRTGGTKAGNNSRGSSTQHKQQTPRSSKYTWQKTATGNRASKSSSKAFQGSRFKPQPQPVPAPPAAASPPPTSYIIPKPAASAAVTTAAVAAADSIDSLLLVDSSIAAGAQAAAGLTAEDAEAAGLGSDVTHHGEPNDDVWKVLYGQQQATEEQLSDLHSGPDIITAEGSIAGEQTPLPTDAAASSRRLLQTAEVRVCNKGTPTNSDFSSSYVKNGFSSVYGEVGISMGQTNVIPPDPTLAVGPFQALHVVNSLVRILPLTPNGMVKTNPRTGEGRLIPLPDFFSLVAGSCSGGYINPAAAYDKEIGRFLLTAICGGDSNQVLLAVSTTSSATGSWIQYSFPGEVTQGSPMVCDGYPISFYSQVTYNKDGVYLTFIQNCPGNQETATGAILLALPKWAVYKGATYFWVPVWTAWDIYNAVGQLNSEEYYPGAFLQLQPVVPQRAEDVQAEVVYFVSDILNYVFPLQRNSIAVVALINTGSLWLYEGPDSISPSPLLVARIVPRGVSGLAVPDTKLVQPLQGSDEAAPLPSQQCQLLDAGAMRPPGVWNGGAALYANTLYIADRGPDIASEVGDIYGNRIFLPTVYWAALTPSFCVSGPCAPWFGSDWGWSEGWDWVTGTWAADSARGKHGYTDPGFYNQVFLYPTGTTSSAPASWKGRKLQQDVEDISSSEPAVQWEALNNNNNNDSSSSNHAEKPISNNSDYNTRQVSPAVRRDAVGVPIRDSSGSSSSSSGVSAGSLTAAAIRAQLGPTASREQFVAALKAALDRMEQLQPTTVAIQPKKQTEAPVKAAVGMRTAQQQQELGISVTLPAIPAEDIELPSNVFDGTALAGFDSNSSRFMSSNSTASNSSSRVKSVSSSEASPTRSIAQGGRGRGGGGGNANTFQAAPAPSGGGGGQASVSNLFWGGPVGSTSFLGWTGWGYTDNFYYYNYYQFWREHYFLRNLYMNLRIPPKVNPCKYYKDWTVDNTVTFGAIVSRRGVLDYASDEQNPVGVAFPQVAVVGGSVLIVFSYSGPKGIPGSLDRTPNAYPGVGYTFIPPDGGNGNFELQVAKLTGFDYDPGCVRQYNVPFWGQYSGIDIHYPSMKVLSAVEAGWSNMTDWVNSNAATWINVFS